MIERSVYQAVKELFSMKPAVLITGARQTGKTTLCWMLSKELGIPYVTLSDSDERQLASTDPDMFIKIHGYPLIIDEIQYAPTLFETLESIIDKERYGNPDCHGLFVLTGSQSYRLMEGISQTMSGRISMVNVSAISISEELGLPEKPFTISPETSFSRNKEVPKDLELMDIIFRGMYPEIIINKKMTPQQFYSDYVDTYIMRDVSELINVKDRQKFRSFMETVAALSGQVINYGSVAKTVSIDQRTAKNWLSVLEAGDIITILRPYSDTSVVKRVAKRPKIYMKDTGLTCYLAKIPDPKMLRSSYLKRSFTETFIINEIIKTHTNKGLVTPFFYYRDSNGNEIDLLMLYDGKLNMIECKSGMTYNPSDIKAFGRLHTSHDKEGCVVCLSEKPYPITKDVYAIPAKTIGG